MHSYSTVSITWNRNGHKVTETSGYFPSTDRIYYSRFNNVPRNTLYTIKSGEYFYFGIARCNTRDDVCMKSVGRGIAQKRARDIQINLFGRTQPELLIEADGLSGVCSAHLIGLVKKYFYDLDREPCTGRYKPSKDDKAFWEWWDQHKKTADFNSFKSPIL